MLPTRLRFKRSELNTNQKQLTEPEKTAYIIPIGIATQRLDLLDQIVEVTNIYAFDLLLPSVAEATNIMYKVTTMNNGEPVTLKDNLDDSVDWPGDFVLTLAGDSVSLRSNGKTWVVVSNEIA